MRAPPTPPRRRAVAALAVLFALLVGGCSDDPSGPGTLTLTVSAPVALGAAVIELEGEGLRGADQPAAGWVELVPVAPRDGVPVHRLVLIRDAPGVLSARLQVRDLAAVRPVATVIQASGGDDRLLVSTADVRVTIRH